MKNLLVSFLFVIVFFLSGIQSAEAIKIGLVTDEYSVVAGTSQKGNLVEYYSGKTLVKLEPLDAYKIGSHGNSITITINGKVYDLKTAKVAITTSDDGFVNVNNRWYRGILIIENRRQSLTVINQLDIESYIKGVVPSEMPSSWHEEALKAQAIAARSYAIANLGKQSRLGFDLKDNTEDQAYGGASAETYKTNKAVKDTEHIVITHDQQVISAYYCASAGGQTANSGDVWFKDMPYLRSVPSYDNNVKKMGHGIGMSQHGSNNLANQGYNAFQILTYYYNNVKFGKLKNPDSY